MKIKIEQALLSSAVQSVQKVVPAKSTSPIVENIFIRAVKTENDTGYIELVGTDNTKTITLKVENVEVKEEGTFCLPGKRFADTIKLLPTDSFCSFNKTKQGATLRNGRTTYNYRGADPAEYPPLPPLKEEQSITLQSETFSKMLKLCAPAIASQEGAKYTLNGICLDIKEKYISVVGTDGKRMSIATIPNTTGVIQSGYILIPRQSIDTIIAVCNTYDEVVMRISKGVLCFETPSSRFYTLLLNGKFPPYQMVIPEDDDYSGEISFDKLEFNEALQRAANFTDEDHSAVKFELGPNTLSMRGFTSLHGDAEAALDTEYSGETFEVGFIPGWWLDLTKLVPDERMTVLIHDANQFVYKGAIDGIDYLCMILAYVA